MQPPARFADASFDTYTAGTPSQAAALREARRVAEALRAQPSWTERLRRRLGFAGDALGEGLYLVGPVGTGKTHLLAALYHALHPGVPCAFLHSSELFRVQAPPEAFARRLAEEADVLCLDEIELDDPANEARLIQVLKALDRLGVFLLATSNVEPEKFLSSAFGNDRFQRFLNEEFRRHYRVVFVGGDDYRHRLAKPGRAWVGPLAQANAAMRAAFEQDRRDAHWLSFDALLEQTIRLEHTRLIRRLRRPESLYLAGIAVDRTDTALRLLRVIDDLYVAPDAPVLYFTAEAAPEAWFDAATRRGVERGIAEKFTRTTSRLRALCEIETLDAQRLVDRG